MGRTAMWLLLAIGVVTAAGASAATVALGLDPSFVPVVASSTFGVVLSAAFVARPLGGAPDVRVAESPRPADHSTEPPLA